MGGHLAFREREILYRLLKAKKPKSESEIAELMGRSRSTVYREIERNTGGRGYRPKQAQRKAQERRLRCRRVGQEKGTGALIDALLGFA